MRKAFVTMGAVLLMTIVACFFGTASPSDAAIHHARSSAPVPLVPDCGQLPQHERRSLYWCTSECGSYMTDITWKAWSRTWAMGFGTFVMKTTSTRLPTGKLRPCSQAIVIPRPSTPAVLYDPKYETLCEHGKLIRMRLFTKASWWVAYGNGHKTHSTYPFIPERWETGAC